MRCLCHHLSYESVATEFGCMAGVDANCQNACDLGDQVGVPPPCIRKQMTGEYLALEILRSTINSIPEGLIVTKNAFQVFFKDVMDKTPCLVNCGQV